MKISEQKLRKVIREMADYSVGGSYFDDDRPEGRDPYAWSQINNSGAASTQATRPYRNLTGQGDSEDEAFADMDKKVQRQLRKIDSSIEKARQAVVDLETIKRELMSPYNKVMDAVLENTARGRR